MPLKGQAGGSLNAWDGDAHRWRQTWVDSGNSWVQFEGGLEGGAMRLSGLWRHSGGPGRASAIPDHLVPSRWRTGPPVWRDHAGRRQELAAIVRLYLRAGSLGPPALSELLGQPRFRAMPIRVLCALPPVFAHLFAPVAMASGGMVHSAPRMAMAEGYFRILPTPRAISCLEPPREVPASCPPGGLSLAKLPSLAAINRPHERRNFPRTTELRQDRPKRLRELMMKAPRAQSRLSSPGVGVKLSLRS